MDKNLISNIFQIVTFKFELIIYFLKIVKINNITTEKDILKCLRIPSNQDFSLSFIR